MNEDAAVAAPEDAAAPPPAVDASEIDYNAPNLARSGHQPTEDGETAPEAAADADATTEEQADAEASDAGKALANRKGSLLADLRTERELRKASDARAAEQERIIQSWQPILSKLEGRPDLQQAVMEGRVTVADAMGQKERADTAELTELAREMDWYKRNADGTFNFDQPDLDRAQKHKERAIAWATKAAAPMVQPLHQNQQTQQASARIEHAVAYATQHGDADPAIVREVMGDYLRRDPGLLLDDRQANTIYQLAIAKTVTETRAGRLKPAAAVTTPPARVARTEKPDALMTEPPGGKVSGPRLTSAERELGKQFGLTDKDWERAEVHAGVKRGYTRLTDDD